MTTETPTISIIIVNYNVKALLKNALDSLCDEAKHLPLEVIVIDNNSTDGSPEMLSSYPKDPLDLRYVTSEVNLGFVGGSNAGARMSRGKYLVFLNPDTIVLPGSLAALASFLEGHREVGIAGPKIVYGNGKPQVSYGPVPSVVGALADVFQLNRLLPPNSEDNSLGKSADGAAQRVGWVSGACLIISSTLFQELHGFDENIFMYSEDADLCTRTRARGKEVVYFEGSKIIHFHAKSSRKVRALALINGYKSRLYYFRKHSGANASILLRAGFSLASFLKACVSGILGLVISREYLAMARAHFLAAAKVWTLEIPSPSRAS